MASIVSARPKGENLPDYQGSIYGPLYDRGDITPDFHELKWYTRIPYLALTTEKDGGSNHRLLDGAEYCGAAHTMSPHYILKRHYALHPVVFVVGASEVIRQRMRGELYYVNAEIIHLMDRQFCLGQKARRIKVKISVEDQSPSDGLYYKGMPWTEAFIYVAIDDYWKDKDMSTYPSCQYPSRRKISGMDFYDYITPSSIVGADQEPGTAFRRRKAAMDKVLRMAAEPVSEEAKYEYLMGHRDTLLSNDDIH